MDAKETASSLRLSPTEWRNVHLLVIDADAQDRDMFRKFAQTLGVGTIQACPTHNEGAALFMERNFSHVLFPATATNMTPKAFLEKVIEASPDTIAIPVSREPTVDDVFSLLQSGARGFLIKPCNIEGLESSLVQASKGEAFSEAILQAKDRNQAFAAVMAASIDRYATLIRQSKRFESASRDIPWAQTNTHKLAKMAKTFSLGGDIELRNAYVGFFCGLAEGPAGRLGRLRDKLREDRTKKRPVSAAASR